MFHSTLYKRLLYRTGRGRGQRCQRRYQLRLEVLEDRWLPSTVTTLLDNVPGSLREAIALTEPGGTVDFEPGLSGTITLTAGQLTIDHDLIITGPGSSVITVSGNNASRVFEITSAVTVAISGLSIADGLATQGGGIFTAASSLIISDSILSNNRAVGTDGTPGLPGAPGGPGGNGLGGGIFIAGGSVEISSSSLSANQAMGGNGGRGGDSLPPAVSGLPGGGGGAGLGGGIYIAGGTLAIHQSTLSANGAAGGDGGQGGDAVPPPGVNGGQGGNGGRGAGGGIYLASGTLEISFSALTDLQAVGGDGGLAGHPQGGFGNGGPAGPGAGGGVYVAEGTVVFSSSQLSVSRALGGTGGGSFGFNSIGGRGGDGSGGGLNIAGGNVTIDSSTLDTNQAVGGPGGGGRSGNRGGDGLGGGIYVTTGLQVNASTLSANRAAGGAGAGGFPTSGRGGDGLGGGIYVAGGPVVVNQSTLSANWAASGFGAASPFGSGVDGTARGGGIFGSSGTLTVTQSTLTVNQATDPFDGFPSSSPAGGGIFNSGSVIGIRNTIVARNNALSGLDVSGTLSSQGHNLIGISDGGSGFATTDLVGTSAIPIDPLLGPLQDNGGPTPTHALLPGSPAIDAGDNTNVPPTDQRGFPRIVNGIVDIGAFEFQAADTTAPSVSCSVAQVMLWPPNHRLVNVGLSIAVQDDTDPSPAVRVQVFANDGADPSDAAAIGPDSLRLRAERSGGGSGRVYLIVVTATDAAGNVGTSVCTVVVPHDQSPAALLAVGAQAEAAEAFYRDFGAAPPGFSLLGEGPMT